MALLLSTSLEAQICTIAVEENESEPAPTAGPPTASVGELAAPALVPSRLGWIDEVRGQYLFWMMCAHAMTQAALSVDHPFQYLRPRGWSTGGFVTLTGLAIGLIYAKRPVLEAHTMRRLYSRSVQVFGVAIASNILFLLARTMVEGTWSMQRAAAILTLQMPWSISSILLPTAAMLALAPSVLTLHRRIGSTATCALMMCAPLCVYLAYTLAPTPELKSLITSGAVVPTYFYFPLVSLLALALAGFGIGIATAELGMVVLGVGAVAGAIVLWTRHVIWWTPPVIDQARFLVVVGGVLLASALPLEYPRRVLALLGRSALLVFLAHRVFVQLAARTMETQLGGGELAAVVIAVTLLASTALAYARDRRRDIGNALREFGL